MAELVGNCPRCKAQEITFGLTQDNLIEKLSGVDGVWCEKAAEARSVLVESPK